MEVRCGIEVLVHARESQIGDVVDDAQLVEHRHPDACAGDGGAEQPHRVLDDGRDRFEPLLGDIASLRGGAEPTDELLAVERFGAAV